ncbi:MAG: type II toxin-antitoxin system Phd/YefM family antitoxin [Oscillospiraceae bacterium]
MPTIRPSADLRNNYNEISDFCHKYSEPVFITKNGKGDLAVMSMETYEALKGRLELYSVIQQGIEDVRSGNEIPFDQGIESIRRELDE